MTQKQTAAILAAAGFLAWYFWPKAAGDTVVHISAGDGSVVGSISTADVMILVNHGTLTDAEGQALQAAAQGVAADPAAVNSAVNKINSGAADWLLYP